MWDSNWNISSLSFTFHTIRPYIYFFSSDFVSNMKISKVLMKSVQNFFKHSVMVFKASWNMLISLSEDQLLLADVIGAKSALPENEISKTMIAVHLFWCDGFMSPTEGFSCRYSDVSPIYVQVSSCLILRSFDSTWQLWVAVTETCQWVVYLIFSEAVKVTIAKVLCPQYLCKYACLKFMIFDS